MSNIDRNIIGMIILDLAVLVLIILSAFNGYRRGAIKAFFSFFWLLAAFIATSLLYEKAATFLQALNDVSTAFARVTCFSIIFIAIFISVKAVDFILMRLLGSLDPKSRSSSIIGIILGIMYGVLFASIIMMNVAFYPPKPPFSNSISFKTMKTIAPSISGLIIRKT